MRNIAIMLYFILSLKYNIFGKHRFFWYKKKYHYNLFFIFIGNIISIKKKHQLKKHHWITYSMYKFDEKWILTINVFSNVTDRRVAFISETL